ncbi:MAG: hypothetical protein ACK55N_13935, partial [Planctomycetota bacterium]
MRLVGWMLGLWWVLGRVAGAQEPPPNAAAPQAPRVVEALCLGDSNTYSGDYVAMFEAASLVAGQRLEHVPVGDGLGDAGW